MACTAQSMIAANSCCALAAFHRILKKPQRAREASGPFFSANASSTGAEESDCNAEECAPDKEVGKVSMEWLAGEKTKVVGTFPPRRRGWTGYVEKDTAGQTNIYSVEPAVYVAESAISSGSKGTSADGAENTLAIVGSIALISIATASIILIQAGKNQPQVETAAYSGPPLSYYINKFKPVQIVEDSDVFEASVLPTSESSSSVEAPSRSELSSASAVEA